MTAQEYMKNRSDKYDIEIELALNLGLSEDQRKEFEYKKKELDNLIEVIPIENREKFEEQYNNDFEQRMDEYYTQLAIDYENRLKEEGFIIDIENPEIVRLTGRITTQNGNSFSISHKSIDVDVSKSFDAYKVYSVEDWMNWFDIKTGGNCKRDEDEFSIEFLRKIN